MSIVNHETGEVVDLDVAAAERRADRIAARLDGIRENFDRTIELIREAIEKRDDMALGYNSPGHYISERFGDSLSGLPRSMRESTVQELTQAGMSTRAIAPVVGISQMQVHRDQRAGVTDVSPAPQSPEPRADVEADADSGQTSDPETTTPASGAEESQGRDAVDDSGAETADPASRPAITGLDGRRYPRPEPKPRQPSRRPLPDAFFEVAYDTAKKVASLHRLITDDRFPQNAEKVAAKHRNDLLRTRDLLEQVINSLPEQESTRD